MSERGTPEKSPDAFRTISEVAEELKLPQHVLRFWETRFPQVKPLKRAGGRRFYRPEDVALLRAIQTLLYGQGYTIKGVQRLLQDHGPRGVAALQVPAPGDTVRPQGPRQGGEGGMIDDDRDRAEPRAEAAPPAPLPLPSRTATAPAADPGVPARLEALARDLADCARVLAAARAGRGRA